MRESSRARADANSDIHELRLGIVCYGGVSLAIYMHGVTKEVQKLVVASRAFESDPHRNPFSPDRVESAYWNALRRRYEVQGVVTRVVVDVVSGTSAGGINGVILCKALAQNRSQEPLRKLWFEKGDIRQLSRRGIWHWLLHQFEQCTGRPSSGAQAPLDGQAMFGWLVDALDQVDRTNEVVPPSDGGRSGSPLVPDGLKLKLFVTTTDYNGYRQAIPIHDPAAVIEARNRHLFEFGYLCEQGVTRRDQFDTAHNVALGFAARCTSSFPGAFPPMSIDSMNTRLAQLGRPAIDVERFKKDFFRAYDLSGADAAKTCFIDGGVLANYPFRPAIDAIAARRSEAQVTRRLIYLQPDPGAPIAESPDKPPGLLGVIWAGLHSIASSQPILDDMLQVREFNARVRRTCQIIDQAAGPIEKLLDKKLQIDLDRNLLALPLGELRKIRQRIEHAAERMAGYAWASYFQIRVSSIVDQFANGVCQICRYKTENVENNIQYFVGLIVEEWARRQGYVGGRADAGKQRDLVARFDVGYLRRRLAFVIEAVNRLYTAPDPPRRADLNRAKAALYDGIDALSQVIRGDLDEDGLTQGIGRLFPLETLRAFQQASSPAGCVASHVDAVEARLTEALAGLGTLVAQRIEAVIQGLHHDFGAITAAWPAVHRRSVLLRFLGFPFWDTLAYPVTRLSQAGELREIEVVRVSPLDSTSLGAATEEGASTPQKLMGVKFAHFGAFFSLEARQNDYLWGRLDGAERLIGLLLDAPPSPADVYPAFAAVLAEEESGDAPLSQVAPLLARIRAALNGMSTMSSAAEGGSTGAAARRDS